jgi:catechol 2,3-dioxygenase-like lactoylglutathione lyase family enzyme
MKIMLEHVALRVTDLERSVAFYRDGLGFKPVGQRKVAEDAITQAVFRVGEGVLVLFYNPNSERAEKDLEFETRQISAHLGGRGERKWRGGMDHFSISLPDEEYNAAVRRLKEQGYTPHRGPVKNLGAFGLGYATYFYDPDNIEVEIKRYDDPPEQPAPELIEEI